MTQNNQNYFFFGLLSAAIVLAVFIFLPFLSPLVLATALTVLFAPIHRRLLKHLFKNKENSSVGAFLSVLIIAVIVFIPIAFITIKMTGEVKSVYTYMTDESSRSQVVDVLNRASLSVSHALLGVFPAYSFDSFNFVGVFKNIAGWAVANLNGIVSGVSKIAISFFVMCLALFYFLRDGREFKRQIVALSPLVDVDDEHIFSKLEQAIRSIFIGSISVSVIQGILTGIGFAIFGVPNPALWGVIAAVSALIPGIGTSLVLVPGIAYLFLVGSSSSGVGLIIWGALAVGLIDNLLAPILVNRGVKIHPFLILLSVLGGIIFFGPIGFVLGPLVLAFLFSLLEIYSSSKKRN